MQSIKSIIEEIIPTLVEDKAGEESAALESFYTALEKEEKSSGSLIKDLEMRTPKLIVFYPTEEPASGTTGYGDRREYVIFKTRGKPGVYSLENVAVEKKFQKLLELPAADMLKFIAALRQFKRVDRKKLADGIKNGVDKAVEKFKK